MIYPRNQQPLFPNQPAYPQAEELLSAAPALTSGKQPKQIRLNQRDTELLKFLAEGAKYASISQLTALFWSAIQGGDLGALRGAQRRTKQLCEAGILRLVGRWILIGQGTQEHLYALDKLGVEIVCLTYGLDPATIDWNPNTRTRESNYLFMSHVLAANDLGVAITLSCEKQGFALLTWLHELELRKEEMRDYVLLAQAADAAKRLAIVPDNFFRIQTRQIVGTFPAEIDRGTESLTVWKEKVQGYIQYQATEAYKERYGAKNFRLLTITTTEKRLMHLKAATEAVAPGDDRFYFTTMDNVVTKQPARYTYTNPKTQKQKLYYKAVYNDELLTQQVWSRAGDTELHSLLE